MNANQREKIVESLKSPDLFGRRVNLLYNEQDYFKTHCGAVGTIILIFGISVVAYFQILKLFRYTVQNLDYFETNKNHKNVLFQNTNFQHEYTKFAIFYESSALHSNSLIDIKFRAKNKTQYLEEEVPDIKRIECKEMNFTRHLDILFAKEYMENCFQVKTEDIEKIPFKIDFEKKCEKKNCNKSIVTKVPMLFFLEVNNNDITNENEIYELQKLELTLNKKIEKKVQIDLIELQTVTFNNPMRSDLLFRGILFSSHNEYIIDLNPEKLLMSLELNLLTHRKIMVKRTIYQFQHFLSLIGGLMKGATVIVFICIWPFREVLYYRKLVNEMFVLCHDQSMLKGVMKLNKKVLKRKETDKSKKEGISENGEDDLEIKKLVEKITSLKKNFQTNGIFHKIFDNKKLTRRERRESMRILGLAGLKSERVINRKRGKSVFARSKGKLDKPIKNNFEMKEQLSHQSIERNMMQSISAKNSEIWNCNDSLEPSDAGGGRFGQGNDSEDQERKKEIKRNISFNPNKSISKFISITEGDLRFLNQNQEEFDDVENCSKIDSDQSISPNLKNILAHSQTVKKNFITEIKQNIQNSDIIRRKNFENHELNQIKRNKLDFYKSLQSEKSNSEIAKGGSGEIKMKGVTGKRVSSSKKESSPVFNIKIESCSINKVYSGNVHRSDKEGILEKKLKKKRILDLKRKVDSKDLKPKKSRSRFKEMISKKKR